MAKKLIALILSVMLILSLAVIPAAAADSTRTVKVGVISYLIDELGAAGWQVHYWDSTTSGDANAVAAGTTEQKAVGSAYWENAEQTFTMFTAEIPADATGIKVHNGNRWFGDDGVAGQKAYVFNYSSDKALYVEDVQPVDPENPTEPASEDPTTAEPASEDPTTAEPASEAPVETITVKFTDAIPARQ